MNRYGWVLFICLYLAACTTISPPDTGSNDLGNELNYLAKSDIDTVADIHLQRLDKHLESLAYKLYRRNPRYCSGGTPSIDACVKAIFSDPKSSSILTNKTGTDALTICFDNDFKGDRVHAFVYGLRSMLYTAYGDKKEFFITDELAPQKLYNSARNIEIAVWRLSNYRDDQGRLFLLSNGIGKGVPNLSFERLFGKMVSLQDTLARIVAESTKRRIKNVIQRLATAVFLPI